MKAREYRPRGILRHIGLPNTVASFRTWRGFQAPIAQPPKACAVKRLSHLSGESGIRTHGGVTPTHAFQACSLNHSDISPVKTLTVPYIRSAVPPGLGKHRSFVIDPQQS